MKALSSRVLYKASPVMLAVALGLLGPAALNDDEDDTRIEACGATPDEGMESSDSTIEPATDGVSDPGALG